MSYKNVLVTGGALRIGKDICLRMHQMGFNVICHYNKSEAEAKKLAAKLAAEKAAEEAKKKAEEEERIREENRRIKEWEDKFDQEQQKKEEELIKKFYSDNSLEENVKTDDSEENKNS